MQEYITISNHIKIETARKDIRYGTDEKYDEENPEHVSEWAVAVTLARYKIGERVHVDELSDQLASAKMLQLLEDMEAKGLLMSTIKEDGEIGYFLPPAEEGEVG